MEETTPNYMVEFDLFQTEFKRTETSPDQAGELIMHLAGHYARYNMLYADKLRRYSAVMTALINSVDPQSGKSMTASKAEILGSATPEAAEYQLAKVHINNLQEMINAIKSLQKALSVEYGNSQ